VALTNYSGVSLPLAVWLAGDDYDFDPSGKKAISATALLRPTRQILLAERLDPTTTKTPDVTDRIASRLGHAIHDSIEKVWKTDYRTGMKALGYDDEIIDRVRINPTPEELKESNSIIPIYLEQRGYRDFGPYVITGKFDMILDGEINDFKTTSVYSLKGDKDEQYQLQGSIYRWLNPEKVTADHMQIQFIFTDWSRAEAKRNPNYPQSRVYAHVIPLLSLAETENWITAKIRELENSADLPEHQLPRCTDKDLWRGETVWKYYSDPTKVGGRSTKNFNNASEAHAHRAKAGRGIVIEVPGKVKACSYCSAFNICTQKDEYDHG